MRKLNNYTEEEIISTIQGISARLAPKYVFPGYDIEDIEQEAFLLGLEAVDKYDEDYKLSSFLFSHINNRLKTLKRNEYYRMEQGSAKQIQDIKRKINSPEGFSDEFFQTPSLHDEGDLYYQDLMNKINEELPAENRSDFIRLTHGEKIPQTRRDTLTTIIKDIINCDEYEDANYWEDM
jgi:DNA-directed RNA polymerase specialized sigma24 family protein